MSALSLATAASTCPFDTGGSDVLNDGVVLTRYALGITGAPMIASTRYASLDPLQVKANIECVGCTLDINGDGVVDTVDTTIIARHLAGFQGASLTAGLALGAGTRNTAAAVTSFLANGCAVGGAINAFVLGGNSFAAPAVLGTNDAQPLTIKTNGAQLSLMVLGGGLRIVVSDSVNAPNVVNGSMGNSASGLGSTVAGGSGNFALPNYGAVGGGAGNTANNSYGAISGGFLNTAGYAATVPGGIQNATTGDYSFAAGSNAKATHTGAFVWSDANTANYQSVAANTFNIRASGGVHLNPATNLNFGATTRQMINLWGTTPGIDAPYGIGVQSLTTYFRTDDFLTAGFCWYAGGIHNDAACNAGGGAVLMKLNYSSGLTVNGTFVSASDRNLKENIHSISAKDMLTKVIALPMNVWNYKQDSGKVKHIGPMAQDFKRLFNVGPGRQNDFYNRRQWRRHRGDSGAQSKAHR